MEEITFEALERRLEALERKCGHLYEVNIDVNCTEALDSISSQLLSSLATREKIAQLFKRVKEIEKYLDPEYASKLTLTEDAKFQIILSEEDKIRNLQAQLEKVNELKTVLDSEHIKACPKLYERLQPLCTVNVEQMLAAQDQTEELQNLVDKYNQLIDSLTKQFVVWDDLLTKMEMAKQAKKTRE